MKSLFKTKSQEPICLWVFVSHRPSLKITANMHYSNIEWSLLCLYVELRISLSASAYCFYLPNTELDIIEESMKESDSWPFNG